MKSERLRILQAEPRADMTALSLLAGKYDLIKAKLSHIKPDEFDYAALAYTIVNLYNLMENYFGRVAKCFENNIEPSRWHRDLVARMSLEIEGIRPAVLHTTEVPWIDELRAFRHVFRHILPGRARTLRRRSGRADPGGRARGVLSRAPEGRLSRHALLYCPPAAGSKPGPRSAGCPTSGEGAPPTRPQG